MISFYRPSMNRLNLQTPLAPLPWPDPPTRDFLLQPRRSDDLLAHWEWWLYNNYLKAHEEGEIYKNLNGEASPWTTWWKAQTRMMMWERLSGCDELTHLCRTAPSRQLHEILTLLFLFFDMVENKTMDGVFGFQARKEEDRTQRIKRDQKIAAKLEAVRRAVAGIPRDHDSADRRNTVDQLLAGEQQAAQRSADPGPRAVVFNLTTDGEDKTFVLAPEAPEESAASTTGRGKPSGTGGDLNMYLTLLVDPLDEMLHGRGHLKAALAILDAFSPPQFQKKNRPWTENTLGATVNQFKCQGGHTGKQAAIAEQLRALRAWLETTAVRGMCPVPLFLLHMPSASVTDLPR